MIALLYTIIFVLVAALALIGFYLFGSHLLERRADRLVEEVADRIKQENLRKETDEWIKKSNEEIRRELGL